MGRLEFSDVVNTNNKVDPMLRLIAVLDCATHTTFTKQLKFNQGVGKLKLLQVLLQQDINQLRLQIVTLVISMQHGLVCQIFNQ